MDAIFAELVLIALLILANGFFSGAELAILTARRSAIARRSAAGSGAARIVAQLQDDPHRFLATVQVGVTVVGSLASALGGIVAVETLRPLLAAAPWAVVRDGAEALAVGLVVAVIAYLTLIFGELAPKSVALQRAERVALLSAWPLHWLARSAGLAVRLLTLSNRAVLRLAGIRPEPGTDFITREEVLHTVMSGGQAGVLSATEQQVMRNALDFTQTRVAALMVPRPRMVALDLDLPRAALLAEVRAHRFSRYPVYRGERENLLGILHGKDLFLHPQAADPAFPLERLLRPPLYVPETTRADALLRQLQHAHQQLAIVVDEYGGISGLVTTEDLLEELVGEIEDEHDASHPLVQRLPDGSLLVDGQLPLHDLAELLDVPLPAGLPVTTLAGLILAEFGRFPAVGESLTWQGHTLECREVTPTSVERVRIVRP